MVLNGMSVSFFTQAINYNHLMPTRYALELDSLKGSVSAETLKEESQKVDAKKAIKKVFEQKYQAGQNKWFFTPLRVCRGCIFISALSY